MSISIFGFEHIYAMIQSYHKLPPGQGEYLYSDARPTRAINCSVKNVADAKLAL